MRIVLTAECVRISLSTVILNGLHYCTKLSVSVVSLSKAYTTQSVEYRDPRSESGSRHVCVYV